MNNPDSDLASSEQLNYFNYFTEVEDEFVRRRGAHLLISPMDWALIESWRSLGIPLHIVLRGINTAFDSYDARPMRAPTHRKVNSVLYCQQSVEEAFAEYQLSQVGAAPPEAESRQPEEKAHACAESSRRKKKTGEAFSRESLLQFLDGCIKELHPMSEPADTAHDTAHVAAQVALPHRQPVREMISRVKERLAAVREWVRTAEPIDPEALEKDLDALDRLVLESLRTAATEEEMDRLRSEARSQLRSYKKKMDKTIYDQTVENFVARRLREIGQIPRLSLFYMS